MDPWYDREYLDGESGGLVMLQACSDLGLDKALVIYM